MTDISLSRSVVLIQSSQCYECDKDLCTFPLLAMLMIIIITSVAWAQWNGEGDLRELSHNLVSLITVRLEQKERERKERIDDRSCCNNI